MYKNAKNKWKENKLVFDQYHHWNNYACYLSADSETKTIFTFERLLHCILLGTQHI